MKISGISNISPIAFGKKFISKVPVTNFQTGKRVYLDFYSYGDDLEKDARHIAENSNKWEISKNRRYAETIRWNLTDNDVEIYGIEDDKENIQALCLIRPFKILAEKGYKRGKYKGISWMTVNPKNAYGSCERQYLKLGTSMFKKILEMARENGVDLIRLADESYGFWENMPHSTVSGQVYDTLKEDYDDCIRKLDEMI